MSYRGIVKDSPFLPDDAKDRILRFIDLGEFGQGNPMFDFGMAMITMSLLREEVMKEMYHTDKPTSLRFWHAFLKAYFGNDCRIDEIEEEIRPFVA